MLVSVLMSMTVDVATAAADTVRVMMMVVVMRSFAGSFAAMMVMIVQSTFDDITLRLAAARKKK